MSNEKSFIRRFFEFGIKKEYSDDTPLARRQPSNVDEVESKPESQINQDKYNGWLGIPRREMAHGRFFDYINARSLALTPTPCMCRNRLIADTFGTACEIVALPKAGADKPTSEAEQHAKEAADWLFFRPNDNGESMYTIIAKAMSDLIDLDAGVIIKEYSRRTKQLMQIHARDGATFLQVRNRYRRLGEIRSVQWDNFYCPNYKVGYWENPSDTQPIPWEPHEVVYMIANPRTDIYYGTSPYTVLRVIGGALQHSEEFYKEFMMNGALGSLGVSSSKEMQATQYDTWKERVNKILRGSKMIKTITADSDAKFTPLGHSLKDMLWHETREEYRNLTMAIFGLTPAAMGFSNNSRGSSERNVESQKALYIRMGLWPRLKTLEWYINNCILADFFRDETAEVYDGSFQHGHIGKWAGKPIDIFFRFKLYDPIGYKQQLEIDEKELKLGLKTHNQILASRGYNQVPWGDFNPLFLLDPLKYSQGFSYNILLPKPYSEITGIPATDIPPPSQLLEQVQPSNSDEETVKAYKKSRWNQ